MSIVKERSRADLEQRSITFDPDAYDYEDPETNPPNLDPFYGSLEHYIKMVTSGHSNLLMLDAKGGLGKTHNVRRVLNRELDSDDWTHLKGFTTPVELYKSLWQARHEGHILFLDDMSGVTNNTKAVEMLKAATDTDGAENWVEYRTSQTIDHPSNTELELPNTFNFRGRLIMSFNETPDKAHFEALKDRGTFFQLAFTYKERLELIREIAKLPAFSGLSVAQQQEVAEWVAQVTDASMQVSIRTFEEVCSMRHYAKDEPDANWERMALEVFDINHEKYLIIRMREHSDLPVEKQVEHFKEETGRSESYYYDLLADIKSDRLSG